jgi:segregation and condensation protein B
MSAADDESPLSLRRLRSAFAAMLRPGPAQDGVDGQAPSGNGDSGTPQHEPCETNPRSIAEAMLFVGRPDGGPMSARELAAAMRGVSPLEIDAAVRELNERYEQDGAPYAISGSPHGYRLELRDEFRRVRDRFDGRIRESRLSSAAMEVLAIVAYNQPVTAEETNQLRGKPSSAILATLVRRRLLRLERADEPSRPPRYVTTDRFLRLFGLENLSALPRGDELMPQEALTVAPAAHRDPAQ